MRQITALGLGVVALLCIPIDSLADQILCADGRPRQGLVLEHRPNKTEGLVVSYIPFRGANVDSSSYGIEKTGDDVWGQKCDVVLSPSEQRSAMIREWRKYVPVATVSRRDGAQVTLIRAGIGINARNALVCIGYCGRSRVLELTGGSAAKYVSLNDVRRMTFSVGAQSPQDILYVTVDGKDVQATIGQLDRGRYYFAYGFIQNEPGRLTDTEIDIGNIREIVMGH